MIAKSMCPEEVIVTGMMKCFDAEALTGIKVFERSKLNMKKFSLVAGTLWESAAIIGEVNEGCCQRGCGVMCVSYMKYDKVWKLRSNRVG